MVWEEGTGGSVPVVFVGEGAEEDPELLLGGRDGRVTVRFDADAPFPQPFRHPIERWNSGRDVSFVEAIGVAARVRAERRQDHSPHGWGGDQPA